VEVGVVDESDLMISYTAEDHYVDEGAVKRALFKLAKAGRLYEFVKTIAQLPQKKA
jgi:hypothetical protein